MSILIKNMKMPKSCRDCGIEQEGFWCGALDGYQNTRCFTNERRDDCPLVEVLPHGRLIDADALEELFREVIGNIFKRDEIKPVLEHMVRASAMAVEMIKDAPTIIAADGGGR